MKRACPPARRRLARAIELLRGAAACREIADFYADGFNRPDVAWNIVSSPSRTAAFIDRCLSLARTAP